MRFGNDIDKELKQRMGSSEESAPKCREKPMRKAPLERVTDPTGARAGQSSTKSGHMENFDVNSEAAVAVENGVASANCKKCKRQSAKQTDGRWQER
ncbi:unnamed protein product [Ceratitis capitata]|uniref:(Mediterranean fruit fly) hypothetical protein n=1 Tax=Ceratitis capitata TaxID=7213 RepID=A0A811VD13_CERCA|nr:unnamed protein product [Ceratitis capitata]